jgi:hypothetical protein
MLDVRFPLVEPLLALGDGRDELVNLLGMRSDLGSTCSTFAVKVRTASVCASMTLRTLRCTVGAPCDLR